MNDGGHAIELFVLHRIPGQQFPFIFTDQSLHEDRQMSERVVCGHITELISVGQFQQQMEQLRPKQQSLFVAVAILVDQSHLPM